MEIRKTQSTILPLMTEEEYGLKMKQIEEFRNAFQDLEASILVPLQASIRKKPPKSINKLKSQYLAAHTELVALLGTDHIISLAGSLYDVLPKNTIDSNEYKVILDNMVAHQETPQVKSGILHFLETFTPINTAAFTVKLHRLLNAKTAALKELRMWQIKGVDVGPLP